jgi:hypothetical protein
MIVCNQRAHACLPDGWHLVVHPLCASEPQKETAIQIKIHVDQSLSPIAEKNLHAEEIMQRKIM